MTPKQRLTSALTVKFSTMSLTRFLTIVISLCTLVGLVAGAARLGKGALDHTYVARDSFALFQQGLAAQRKVDSTTNATALLETFHVVKGVDSMLRCDHGHREFCK